MNYDPVIKWIFVLTDAKKQRSGRGLTKGGRRYVIVTSRIGSKPSICKKLELRVIFFFLKRERKENK